MSVKIVKSASRIFEILELFDQQQRPMPAVEISDSLGYPLASTHELLKTMVELGYFKYGEPKWAYAPSSRFAEILEWVRDSVSDDTRIINFMSALNSRTKETINLSRSIGHEMKIIKGLETQYQLGVSSKPGTHMPITQSLTGITSLAVLSDEKVEEQLNQLQYIDVQQAESFDIEIVYEIIREVRTRGTATRADIMMRGIGAVCFPIKSNQSDEILVAGIVGPSDRILEHAKQHQNTILELAEKHQISTCFPIRI